MPVERTEDHFSDLTPPSFAPIESLHPYSLFTMADSPQTFARKRQRMGGVDSCSPTHSMYLSNISSPTAQQFKRPRVTEYSRPAPAASRLSMELITYILDFALLSVDLGSNGRWTTPSEAGASKAQWGKGNKTSALLHRKLSLVHRTWTPHVLRSLYHTPRLTSRRSIESFAYCLTHPQDLWGYDGDPVFVEGAPIWEDTMGEIDTWKKRGFGQGGSVTSADGSIPNGTHPSQHTFPFPSRQPAFPPHSTPTNYDPIPFPSTVTRLPSRPATSAGPPMHSTVMSVLARGWDAPVPRCTVPDRRRLVKYLCYNVGTGRASSGDYMLYSGDWFARIGLFLAKAIPDLWGYETESWCALGCDELVRNCTMLEFRFFYDSFRRWSMIRTPAQANIILALAVIMPKIEIIEWIDVGAHVVEPGPMALDMFLDGLRVYTERLRVFALRVRGLVDAVGVMDVVFDILPKLQTLMIQADLISFTLFDKPPAEELTTMMIGMSDGPHLLFRGRRAIEALWETVRGRSEDEGWAEIPLPEAEPNDTGPEESSASLSGDEESEDTGVDSDTEAAVAPGSSGWHWINHGVSIMQASDRTHQQRIDGALSTAEQASTQAAMSTPSHQDQHAEQEAPFVRPPVRALEAWLRRECGSGGSLKGYVGSEGDMRVMVASMCW